MVSQGRDLKLLRRNLIVNKSSSLSSEWIDVNQIKWLHTKHLNDMGEFTVSVAYHPYDPEKQEEAQQFSYKGRPRFLSDDTDDQLTQKQNQRKHSCATGPGSFDLGYWDKCKLSPETTNSKSSKNQNSSHIMSVFSKKDDVEIISSPEEMEKIMDKNSFEDFEIQFVLVDVDLQTLIKEQKDKIQHNSQEVQRVFQFVQNY